MPPPQFRFCLIECKPRLHTYICTPHAHTLHRYLVIETRKDGTKFTHKPLREAAERLNAASGQYGAVQAELVQQVGGGEGEEGGERGGRRERAESVYVCVCVRVGGWVSVGVGVYVDAHIRIHITLLYTPLLSRPCLVSGPPSTLLLFLSIFPAPQRACYTPVPGYAFTS